MGDIKSAVELAMEKLADMGEVTDEERQRWKYVPEGERLAAKYLKDNVSLLAELKNYDEKVQPHVIAGACDILVRNIGLPKTELNKKNNRRAMDGIKALKRDKVAAENVFTKMRRVFAHYVDQGQQQRKQAYEQLRLDFEGKVRQALQKQLGRVPDMKIDIEGQPQFQEEWLKLQSRLEAQYLKVLDEYKQELRVVP